MQAALQRLGTPQQQAALCQNVHVQGKTVLQHAASLGCADVVQTVSIAFSACIVNGSIQDGTHFAYCSVAAGVRLLVMLQARKHQQSHNQTHRCIPTPLLPRQASHILTAISYEHNTAVLHGNLPFTLLPWLLAAPGAPV